MLLGLIRADSGLDPHLRRRGPAALPRVIGRIGAIVEQPKFFPAFSGRRNLELLATGIQAPARRVGEVLDEVGLTGRDKDRFRTYSLGMKQRLAIAATLLKDPDLLIFDEPTNGLDPAGIHEIRATMRGLADRGKTVLVSSHILSEVQQVADTVSIIGRGRLLAEGEVDDILAATGGQAVRVLVADPARAAAVLAPGRLLGDAAARGTAGGPADRRAGGLRPRRRSPGCWRSRASSSPSWCPSGPTWSRCSSTSPRRSTSVPPTAAPRSSGVTTSDASAPRPRPAGPARAAQEDGDDPPPPRRAVAHPQPPAHLDRPRCGAARAWPSASWRSPARCARSPRPSRPRPRSPTGRRSRTGRPTTSSTSRSAWTPASAPRSAPTRRRRSRTSCRAA